MKLADLVVDRFFSNGDIVSVAFFETTRSNADKSGTLAKILKILSTHITHAAAQTT